MTAAQLKRWEDRVQGAQLDLLRMRGQLAELALVHAARQRTLQGPPLERIESAAEVHQMLDQQAIACTQEVLSAQPGGPQPAIELGRARDRHQDLLTRGVHLRTLYQHSARFDPVTVRYAADLGAEARTVTGGLTQCLIFDRTLLVLPLQDATGGALLVRSPDQTKRSILRHLVQGDDDRATARALGISVRTCRRHVSDIMRHLGLRAASSSATSPPCTRCSNPKARKPVVRPC
ncbi:hypothetical protein [Streptomyces sp. G-G2]|uniref:LuxR C-terminal-related transcriptional regulator n=1 Tax=Streptomyces sp. G-G2 TaxID=3046201 RepID=UPI0024BA0A7B|nr:hypothetical protein [Streptomyces sp. G-G2]MDJ0382621.1 hypothetical protein [Streptomyces sp. G-G2]